MILSIPAKAKTLELSSSIVWFDEDGILYSLPKENAQAEQSMSIIRKEMVELRNFTGGQKVCIISESSSRATSPPKSQRDVLAEELNSIVKAFAILSSSPLSRMVANLFFSFKPPPYPFKMFSTEQEAKEWVKKFL